jgi:hypothetical protein
MGSVSDTTSSPSVSYTVCKSGEDTGASGRGGRVRSSFHDGDLGLQELLATFTCIHVTILELPQ